MEKEIERKYAIETIPENLEIEKIVYIEQAYLYHDSHTTIRIRRIEPINKKQSIYVYTIKTTGDIHYENNSKIGKKYEIENRISQEEYNQLLSKKISELVCKTRIVSPIANNLKAEIDIYYHQLEDLLTLEIEFQNEEQANNFLKPDWIGKELGYQELSNRKLAELTREELLQKMTKEEMEKNQKNIQKLKEKFNLNSY